MIGLLILLLLAVVLYFLVVQPSQEGSESDPTSEAGSVSEVQPKPDADDSAPVESTTAQPKPAEAEIKADDAPATVPEAKVEDEPPQKDLETEPASVEPGIDSDVEISEGRQASVPQDSAISEDNGDEKPPESAPTVAGSETDDERETIREEPTDSVRAEPEEPVDSDDEATLQAVVTTPAENRINPQEDSRGQEVETLRDEAAVVVAPVDSSEETEPERSESTTQPAAGSVSATPLDERSEEHPTQPVPATVDQDRREEISAPSQVAEDDIIAEPEDQTTDQIQQDSAEAGAETMAPTQEGIESPESSTAAPRSEDADQENAAGGVEQEIAEEQADATSARLPSPSAVPSQPSEDAAVSAQSATANDKSLESESAGRSGGEPVSDGDSGPMSPIDQDQGGSVPTEEDPNQVRDGGQATEAENRRESTDSAASLVPIAKDPDLNRTTEFLIPDINADVQAGEVTLGLGGSLAPYSPPTTELSNPSQLATADETRELIADADEALAAAFDIMNQLVEGDPAILDRIDPDRRRRDGAPTQLAGEAEHLPDFDVVRVDRSGTVTAAGRAVPFSTVTVLVNGATGAVTGANEIGDFAAVFGVDTAAEIPPTLSLEMKNDRGPVIQSRREVIILAPKHLEGGVFGVSASEEMSLTQHTDHVVLIASENLLEILQAGFSRGDFDNLANIALDSIYYDDTGEVGLLGRGRPEMHARVYVDSRHAVTVPIQPDGKWRTSLSTVGPGIYTLRIDEVDDTGQVLSRLETPFQKLDPEVALERMSSNISASVSAVLPRTHDDPQSRVVTVQPGNTLWGISRSRFGLGRYYIRIYAANKDQIRDPDLIYPGQVFLIPD